MQLGMMLRINDKVAALMLQLLLDLLVKCILFQHCTYIFIVCFFVKRVA